jgi:hypothetical protein
MVREDKSAKLHLTQALFVWRGRRLPQIVAESLPIFPRQGRRDDYGFAGFADRHCHSGDRTRLPL